MTNFFDNWKDKTGDGHKRYDWSPNFKVAPEDYSLATTDLNSLPPKILETYTRFYRIGWVHEYGNQCILMSNMLRRVLRLHGVEAHCKQVTLLYEKPEKNWYAEIGQYNSWVEQGTIDTHMVVVADGFICDFAMLSSVHYTFGAMAPIACIVKHNPEWYGEPYDTGFFGKFTYTPRTPHRLTKHWIYENRDREKALVKDYFEYFRM